MKIILSFTPSSVAYTIICQQQNDRNTLEHKKLQILAQMSNKWMSLAGKKLNKQVSNIEEELGTAAEEISTNAKVELLHFNIRQVTWSCSYSSQSLLSKNFKKVQEKHPWWRLNSPFFPLHGLIGLVCSFLILKIFSLIIFKKHKFVGDIWCKDVITKLVPWVRIKLL